MNRDGPYACRSKVEIRKWYMFWWLTVLTIDYPFFP